MVFTRVYVGRSGLIVGTLASRACGIRGARSTVVWRAEQRRGISEGVYTVLPPPPPPFNGPAQHDRYGGDRDDRKGPVVITVKNTRGEVLMKVLVTGLMFATIWLAMLMLYTRGGVGGRDSLRQGKSVSPVDLDTFHITFSEVLGCDEAKEELEEIVLFLKDPDRFTALGGKLPKGALLVGPPGTGKTMLAKAIAKEAGVPFFYMSGSEFDEVFVGVGSRRVRDLFEAVKKASPALIFIDELDAIGGRRSARDQSYQRMTLNQLLAEMDGFLSSDKVIVLGATNTPKTLDSALTRPGRLDRIINVDPPDLKGREAILNMYLKRVRSNDTIDSLTLARGLPGYCGAELQNIVNTAAIRAAMLEKDEVDSDDLEYARDRVSMGAENRSRVVPEHERRVTAWHEAGHALAALLSEGADPVHKATIIPRGSGILGMVLQHPSEDRYSASRQVMLARLVIALAGRAGEEELLGDSDVTSGAASDFESATSLARVMVRKYGMAEEELGVVDYSSTNEHTGAYLSDTTKEKIENATRTLLDEAYTGATTLLKENRSKLQAIAEALLSHETLDAGQLDILIAGGTLPPPPGKPSPRPKDEVGSEETSVSAKKPSPPTVPNPIPA